MLHLYNLEHLKIKGLKAYKDYCIESTLSTGDKVLSFLYPSYLGKDIIEESYIRTKTAEFVVKEIDDQNQWKSIKAVLNVEDLEGKEWEQFDSTEQTITDCLRLAIAGTGWTIGTCNVTRRRTVRKTNCSAWEVIQEAKKRYRVEIEFDTLNKKINIAEKLGTDKGVYFMDSLNLKNLNIQGNSYDFYTRIIAKGKEDLKVIVENHQYSNKTKTLIWKDERYTDEASLREDATAKLKELSKPYRAYSADILDLANMSQKYKDILEYSLGDTITLISKENGIREKQRLVTIREYPDEPQRNTCEIANTTLKFEDIQKEYQDTTDTVNNITADDGTISEEAVKNAFTVFNKINANEINVLKGQFGELKVNKLDVDVANIKFTEINKAIINKADIVQLNAVSVKVKVLEGDSASFKNVLAGNITADNIQTKFLQTLQGWMLEGSIGNAQISDLNANKIRSGTVDTSLVTVAGPGGRLTIQGNKLQVFDSKSGKLYERIMLGIDNNNNSSLVLRGADGNTVLITQDGLTKAGFTDGYNKLDNNSLDSSKLDINSVVRRINGSTEKIESTVIQVGNKTLNILLQEQNNTITEHGKSLSTQEARITANKNSIKLKVDTQTYSQDKTTINKSIETTLVNSKAYADTKKNEAISTASADATTKSNNAKNAAINTAATDATTKANAAKDTAIAEAQKKADKALADSKLYVNQEITTVNSNLSKATSDISVLKGQIALKVEQSDIDSTVTTVKNELITKMDDIDKAIADVITTTDTKISKAKADIKIETDKIALNVSNLTTKTSTIETQLGDKATKAEVKTVSDKAASIEANLNGITQRVSSTESTVRSHTTQIGAVDGKINTAKTDAINTAGADAQKKADNAKNAAINTAATDATNKANKAKTDAISTASADATTKANNALKDGKSYTDIGLKPVKDTLATHTIEINTTKQQVSTIETNLGSITSRVSTVENKTTTIDGKLIKQETRLQSAENKLTPTSIVSSVNEALNGNSSSISTTSTTLSKNSFEVRNAAFKLYDTYGDLALSSGGGWTYTQGKYQVSVSPHNKPRVRGVTLSSGNCNVLPYGIVQETFNSIPLVLGSNSLKVEIRNMIDTEWGNLEANSISAEGIHSAHGKGAYLSLIRNELNIGSGASSSNLWLNYFSTVEDPQVVVGNGSYGGWGHLSAGSLYVTGSKNCIQETENYGYRAINAYETADYYLGDIGEGNIGEDGLCYVSIDDVFMETVNTKCNYQVFLTKYGKGDIWVKERTENYFIVEGTPGLLFGGEIKAKRKGYETDRLEIADIIPKVSMDFRLSKEDESVLNSSQTADTLYVMDNKVRQQEREQEAILNNFEEEI
ncbi:phage tail spike protein [Clostridium cadaveris]|uniref:phage tail spike protein n=1 Tax=Clostridium cadaveris TaxID=1529 RepID=UPI000C08CC81|nr:phage tail spike protein [Clostridium cadaveris]